MKKERLRGKIKRRRIEFTLEAPAAGEVIVAGDFNNWNLKSHPMKKAGNGIWNRTMVLPVGTYEYKFLIDGNWRLDPQNRQVSRNCFGSLNNVLRLTEG